MLLLLLLFFFREQPFFGDNLDYKLFELFNEMTAEKTTCFFHVIIQRLRNDTYEFYRRIYDRCKAKLTMIIFIRKKML